MKFTVKDMDELPELGVFQLAEAGRTLESGKVIVVKNEELPYNSRLVLANLSKWTKAKWRLHTLDGSVGFEKIGDRPTEKLEEKEDGFPIIRKVERYRRYRDHVKDQIGDRGGGSRLPLRILQPVGVEYLPISDA